MRRPRAVRAGARGIREALVADVAHADRADAALGRHPELRDPLGRREPADVAGADLPLALAEGLALHVLELPLERPARRALADALGRALLARRGEELARHQALSRPAEEADLDPELAVRVGLHELARRLGLAERLVRLAGLAHDVLDAVAQTGARHALPRDDDRARGGREQQREQRREQRERLEHGAEG